MTSRPMFGLIGFYRDRKIFAALPRTRAADTPFSLLIKLPGAFDDDRLHRASGPGASWVTFAMESEGDIPDALGWLERGYEAVKARPSRPRRPR